MIKLYTQDGCPQCRMVHMLLDNKHIQYEECKNVDYMKSIGINHTPALEVEGVILQGKEMMDYIKTETLPYVACNSCEVK